MLCSIDGGRTFILDYRQMQNSINSDSGSRGTGLLRPEEVSMAREKE